MMIHHPNLRFKLDAAPGRDADSIIMMGIRPLIGLGMRRRDSAQKIAFLEVGNHAPPERRQLMPKLAIDPRSRRLAPRRKPFVLVKRLFCRLPTGERQ